MAKTPPSSAELGAPARFGGLLVALLGAACGGSEEPLDPVNPVRADPRVDELIYEACARTDHYDRDTADIVPALVEKLVKGKKEPMRRAKQELSELGEPAAAALLRLVDQYFSDPNGAAYIQNALDALAGMQGSTVTSALVRCLGHPVSSVRARALRALAQRPAEPSDYERLRQHLDFEGVENRPLVVSALHHADPARAEAEFLRWLRDGSYTGLWPHLQQLILESQAPGVLEAASELYAEAPIEIRSCLAVLALRGGDEEAGDLLRSDLASPYPVRRTRVVLVLNAREHRDLLLQTLAGDPEENIRLEAAQALSRGEPDAEVRAALVQGMDDRSLAVRSLCLDTLVGWSEDAAVDRALADLLSPSRETLMRGMDSLRPAMQDDPGLADRAFERLRKRYEREQERSLTSQRWTLQVMGQVPSEAAARFLHELPLEEGVVIDGFPAARWMLLQLSNTGEPGQALVAADLETETDPLRRLDLIWALSMRRTELAREAMLGALDSPHGSDLERLYLAARLVQLGPATRVAPVLQQAVLRVQEAEVRRAFQCLLWNWY